MPKRTTAYAPWLADRLKDPRVALDYLRASAASPEELLKALRKVAEAHQVSKIAEAAGRQRESVYRMLSEDGNPRLDSLWAVLHAMGLRVSVALLENDQTGGDTAPLNEQLFQRAELVEGNLLSTGGNGAENFLSGFRIITVPTQARKGPGRANVANFDLVGQSAIAGQTGVPLGRQ